MSHVIFNAKRSDFLPQLSVGFEDIAETDVSDPSLQHASFARLVPLQAVGAIAACRFALPSNLDHRCH